MHSGDADTDGIGIGANSLRRNDSAIYDRAGKTPPASPTPPSPPTQPTGSLPQQTTRAYAIPPGRPAGGSVRSADPPRRRGHRRACRPRRAGTTTRGGLLSVGGDDPDPVVPVQAATEVGVVAFPVRGRAGTSCARSGPTRTYRKPLSPSLAW